MRIRALILFAFASFLLWEVLTRGVAAYLATLSPETALALRPTEPTALVNLAEQKRRDLISKEVKPRPTEVEHDSSLDPQSHQDPIEVVQGKPDSSENARANLSHTTAEKTSSTSDDPLRTETL